MRVTPEWIKAVAAVADLLGFSGQFLVYKIRGLASKVVLRTICLGSDGQTCEGQIKHGKRKSLDSHDFTS